MPIKPYQPAGLSPIDTIILSHERQNALNHGWLDREAEAGASPTPGPTFRESLLASTELNSLMVQGSESFLYGAAKNSTPSDFDDNFDVRTYARDDWLADNPFMLEHFLNGDVLDIPNQERFDTFVARKRRDHELRETLGQSGIVRNLLAAAPVTIFEGLTGVGLIRAAGGAQKLAQVAAWGKQGNLAVRTAKYGAIGSSTNVAWEAALHGLYPDRNVELDESLAWAAGMGAVFAGAVPALAGGRNKLGGMVSGARIHRMQRQVGEALADSRAVDAADLVKSDADALRELVREGHLTIATRQEAQSRFMDVDAVGGERGRDIVVVRHAETEPLIREAREVWGDELRIHEHPQQVQVDWLTKLQELDAIAGEAMPANLGPVAGRVAAVMARGIPAPHLASTPGYHLIFNPSSVARSAGRLLFDFSWPTEATMRDPLNTVNRVPAEGLLWQYHALRDRTILSIDDSLRGGLRDGGFTYTTASGEVLTVSSRWRHRQEFHKAAIDYLRQLEEHARGHREKPEAPEPVKKAAVALRHYARRMGREAHDVGFLQQFDPGRIYLPRRWRADVIRLNRAEFKSRLVHQWRQNRERDYWTGDTLDEGKREVAPEVFGVEGSREGAMEGRGLTPDDRNAIAELAGRQSGATPGRPLTEAQLRQRLGDEVFGRYLDEVEIYFDRAADSTIDRLTGMEADSGVDMRSGTSVFAHRTLDVNETAFADFLDTSVETLVGFYHRAVAGRVASRRSIRAAAGDWEPLVKQLTGKSLKESNYDPALVIEAVKRDFQRQLDVAAGDAKAQARIESAMEATVGERGGVLLHKLAELEGRPVFAGNPAAEGGFSVWLARNSLRLPYMAHLGKMAVSSMTDVANLVLLKAMTPRHIGTMAESLNLFRRVPLRRHLEGLYVATADMAYSARSMEIGEVAGLTDARSFGPGRAGRAMARSDAGMEWLSRKFATATTQNRWNTNLKRGTATIVMDEMIHAAAKLARAADLVDGGLDQAAALKQVDLAPEDAARLNRLGMNADRARRLVRMIDEHGVDWDGNRINSTHEGFISPEFRSWWREDRDLFDTFTWAVNTETLNIIVEPKMMSRPVGNSTKWLYRAFGQFQSFFYAWGNQFAPVAAARPRYEMAQYAIVTVGLGGLVDALHNHLSGRRPLEESARLWGEQPSGMLWAAVNRSSILGWLARPVGILENTPYGVGRNLGNTDLSSQFTKPMDVISQFGPAVSYMSDAAAAVQDVAYGNRFTEATHRRAWRVTPWRNLWWLEATLRTAEDMGYGDTFPFSLAPASRPQMSP
jgi:hypothetical protein